MVNSKSPASGARKLHLIQQNAGKCFHQWAEVIINRFFTPSETEVLQRSFKAIF